MKAHPVQPTAPRSPALELDLERAVRELSSLPVSAFDQLPIETRLLTQGSVSKSIFVLSSAPVEDRSRLAATWFDADELAAMAWGVRADRTFASDLIAFALRKLHDAAFRVTLEHALAGADLAVLDQPGASDGSEPTLGELLGALELSVIGIEIGPAARVGTVSTRRAA
jgi:hypothetical protein